MTMDKLAQIVSNTADQFKGHSDGKWYETGHNAYMTADFANVGQATMFAQYLVWDKQVIATVTGGDWDDSTIPAQVTVKRWM